MHVPEFCFNLISVQKLMTNKDINVLFTPQFCFLQDPLMKKPMLIGSEIKGLFIFNFDVNCKHTSAFPSVLNKSFDNSFTNDLSLLNSAVSSSMNNIALPFASSIILKNNIPELWHCRLGHVPFVKLKHINVLDSPIKPTHLCKICPQAKQHRNSFPTSISKVAEPFDLIHIDTWGSYKHATHNGFRYFLTIVDDNTRCTWTFLMSSKGDSLSILQNFHSLILTQFQSKIKIIRSDNAAEFCGSDALKFYSTNDIIHQTSCAYTPQQNGIVERKHKHLLEVARSLLFQSNLPIQFWRECILTATYLINRTPLPSLQFNSPYFQLFNKAPDYSFLRTFGCLCFISTTSQGRDKFQPRAKPRVFIGYSFGKKSYKALDLATHKIFESRDYFS